VLELAERIASDKEYQALISQVAPGHHDALVTGVGGSARHLYYAALLMHKRKQNPHASLFIVTHTAGQAEAIWDDLRELMPDVPVLLFPERERSLIDMVAHSSEVIGERIRVLEHLAAVPDAGAVVICTLASALQPMMTKSMFHASSLTLTVGIDTEMSDVIQRLIHAGYERVDLVEGKGQLSVRGGIMDVFPVAADEPLRIEWFDTVVDSIRTFDITSQRSLEKRTSANVGPASDFLLPRKVMTDTSESLAKHLESRLRTITELEVKERLQTIVGEDVRKFGQAIPFYGQIRYTQLYVQHVSTLLDYCDSATTVCIDEPTRVMERQKGLEREYAEWVSSALMHGEMLSGTEADLPYSVLWDSTRFGRIQFSVFARPTGGHRYEAMLGVTAKTMQNFHGQMNLLKSEMTRWERSGTQVVLFAATAERAERLQRVLGDYRISADRVDRLMPGGKRPVIMISNLSSGFELPMLHLAVIVETEVFTARKKNRRFRAEMSDAERIKSYQDLKPGDYVVHMNHGIGKYHGIRTLEIDGRHKDYLHLQYKGNDSLYVPVEQIDQVQRYIGSEDKEPKLYNLGGGEWSRVKQKVTKTVRDIAEDLVKLYAAREATSGHAFAPDTPWQKDFETMFPYDETPDQLRAISDIKRDMERGRPMDRLLCGDVGYGKTEVAIRAAFKAVMDGKQVAILVPTTVLAQQHFETFKERFSGFPVNIQVLSRFRSKTEAAACIKGLQDGSVDVVIGTHRLLQKSVQFHNVGLLIIDEEQRFGVTHKERLKQMKTNVDCLTLTATPIPRTLHMSMLGVRDLSVIETPPENRFPVQTYVVEFHEGLVREALERELNRGGQVYVLYNQVQSIRTMADRILRLVPEARIAVAHGQMGEDELERVMLDFLEGDIDILVTTTIIETGLDIPNVNTLIVNDADRLGLSQLYQLRGRVGRSNRIAYAYFTYQKDKVLTEVAEKRLQAIKEFTELGSGFKIAMRDLSIRGAGNLLGAEQHGFMNAVGFDMYSEMLSQAVRDIRGEKQEEVPEPSIDLAVEAYLPDTYIPDTAQKIAIYKKFKYVKSLSLADDLEEEVEDRFGELPDSVRNLLDITRIKSLAMRCGIDAVLQQGSETSFRFPPASYVPIEYAKVISAAMKHGGQPMKRPNGTFFVSFRTRGFSDAELLKKLMAFLTEYTKSLQDFQEVEQIVQ